MISLLATAQPATSLESTALHAPPSDYQQIGTCMPDFGRPYYQRQQQFNGPILFYAGSELTMVAYLMTERDLQQGASVTLLGELGGLPISDVSFGPSSTNPFVRPPTPGRYYLMFMHLMTAQHRAGFKC